MAGGVIVGVLLISGFAFLQTRGIALTNNDWVSAVDGDGWFNATRSAVTALGAIGIGGAAYIAYRRQHSQEAERDDELGRDLWAIERDLHARYVDAVKLLGDSTSSIRLGGVYALAALADDWLLNRRIVQAQAVVDVLCSYLRTNTMLTAELSNDRNAEREVRNSIVGVLRARLRHFSNGQPSWTNLRIDLGMADLVGANFAGSELSGSNFFGADLEGANLCLANLTAVDLENANLSRASLVNTRLVAADLNCAKLNGADARESVLTRTDIGGAEFIGAALINADFCDSLAEPGQFSDAQLSGMKRQPRVDTKP